MRINKTTVGDITSLITKGTTPTSLGHQFSNQGIHFLRIQDFNGNELDLAKTLFISPEVDKALSRSKILPGDVLISIAGTIGKSLVVPKDAPPLNCNQAIAILRPLQDVVSSKYLSYWLETENARTQILNSRVTATISNLSLGQIKKLIIELPPIEEQHRIEKILEKVNQLIILRSKTLKDLRSLRLSLIENLLKGVD